MVHWLQKSKSPSAHSITRQKAAAFHRCTVERLEGRRLLHAVTLTGTKFNDLDMNGMQNGTEPGISGFTIQAYVDTNKDGILQQSEFDAGASASTTTGSDGGYTLNLNLDNGFQYIIVEQQQSGWTQSAPSTGVLDPSLDTGGITLGANGYVATFTATGQTISGENFGNFQPPSPPPPHVPGRMTGGGSIFLDDGTRVTHGFELHCSTAANNHLEVNWLHNHFHLKSLTDVTCLDDPSISPNPPKAPIDTLIGTGTGRFSGTFNGHKYKNVTATIQFTFTDAGEPGRNDTADYKITLSDGTVVLDTGGPIKLTYGNQQAHYEIPPILKQEGLFSTKTKIHL